MAKDTIFIGSKLPHGLKIVDPTAENEQEAQYAIILGLNSSKIIGATHMTTEIDADLWACWKTAHPDYKLLKNGTIFEARNRTEADSKGREREGLKTGFEQLNPEKHGVKKAEQDDDK